MLCFWNSFTGEQFKKFYLPHWMASVETGKYIAHVKWPFPEKKDFVLIILNEGSCYMLDVLSETFHAAWNPHLLDNDNDSLHNHSHSSGGLKEDSCAEALDRGRTMHKHATTINVSK